MTEEAYRRFRKAGTPADPELAACLAEEIVERRHTLAVSGVRGHEVALRIDVDREVSASCVVEVLQKLVGGQLDLLVPPLGGAVLTGDQAHPVDSPEIPVHKRVSGLRFVARAVGEPQMPRGVLVPRVRLQEGILVIGARLNLAPLALEYVLVRVDEPPRMCDGVPVDGVGGHGFLLSVEATTRNLPSVDPTFKLPSGDEVTLDEERAAFVAASLRARAGGEHGKIAQPNTVNALADAIDARVTGTATGPIQLAHDSERDTLLAILNVAAMGDTDRRLRELHRAVRAWWSETKLSH